MKGNVIELDWNALRDAITERGKNLSQASRDLGYSDAYISYCISTGQMKESAAKLLCYQLNIPLSQIKKKQAATPQSAASGSYTARIDVSGGKSLNMSLYFGDEKICEAYSKIKGPGKLDLMQAISYAAHMMYKIAEQEELKKRK